MSVLVEIANRMIKGSFAFDGNVAGTFELRVNRRVIFAVFRLRFAEIGGDHQLHAESYNAMQR